MKILKWLLSLVLIALFVLLCSVMFSSNIVSYMAKTKHSEFENVKFSIKNNEMVFDNFVVNGKNLGKGRANVGVIGTGLFKLVPKLTLSNLKLEDVNLEGIYNEKSSQIDTFTDKINSLTTQEKADKSTADFIKETTTKVTTLTTNTDNFINSKLRENIEKTITEIELERDIALTNVSDNLTKLEKEISLNDFNNINSNNSVQNMNLYIFLDKGKDLEISLNSALKATALIKEIKDLNVRIADIDINDGKIVAKGLNGDNTQISGEVVMENNAMAFIKGQNNGYEITYNKDNFTSKTMFFANKISTIIEYSKNDLLEGKIIKLASELVLENNNFKNLNHTVLTDEEKTLLTQKIENLRNNNYQQIMAKYEEDNKNIETLIDNVYVQKNKLDKLQRDLLSLGTIITFEQPTTNTATENTNQTNNTSINILNNSSNNNSNGNMKNTNENQNPNKINIGNR